VFADKQDGFFDVGMIQEKRPKRKPFLLSFFVCIDLFRLKDYE